MPFLAHIVVSMTAAVVGIFFNGYIVLVLLWQNRLRTVNSLLLLHLAIVDILFCLLLLAYSPVLVLDISRRGFSTSHGFLWTLLPTVLVWTVCGISCDRYAAISRPLQYSSFVNTRRALGFVAAIWFIGVSTSVPPLAEVCIYVYQDERWACFPKCSGQSVEMVYLILYICVSAILPVFITLTCNLHVFLIARYHRHRIVSAIYEVTLRAQATVTHQRNPYYLAKYRGRNAVSTIGHYVVTLVVFTVPYYAVILWEAFDGKDCHPALVSAATVLLTCTPPLNAYVYGVKSRILRQTLKRILQRRWFKRQASKEVERRLSLISTRTHRTSSVSRRLSLNFNSTASEKSTSWFDFRQASRTHSFRGVIPTISGSIER